MDSDPVAPEKIKSGTLLGLSGAELAPILKDHEFVILLPRLNQRVHVRATGRTLPSGSIEVVVIPDA